MKKKISIILACALTGLFLVGCTSNLSDGARNAERLDLILEEAKPIPDSSGFTYYGDGPITDENATIKIMAMQSNYSFVDLSDAPIVKKVFEEAHVEPAWQLIPYEEYIKTAGDIIKSGETDADIIKAPDSDLNQVYIKTGMFVPLDDFFDYMPNYVKWLKAHPEEKVELTAEDGHIYYVPGLNAADDYQPCLMFNQVWLKKAGMQAPKTLDELTELLKFFRDNDMNGNGDPTDEIPMSVMEEFLIYMFGPAFGLDLVSGFQADSEGNVTFAYADSENYKEYLKYLNMLYEEGLLEPDYGKLDRDTTIDRISKDLTGVTFDFSWAMSMMYSSVLPYYDGTADTAFVGAAPLSGKYEGYYVGRNPLSGMYGVSANSVQIELAVKFLDFAMSDHCQDYYQWGFEGESYVVNPDGTRAYTEKGLDNNWLQSFGINPAFVLPAAQSVEATDVLVAPWHVQVNKELRKYIKRPWPDLYATTKESDTINLYMDDIWDEVYGLAPKFISGELNFEEDFDEYLNKLDNLSLGEVLEVKKAQYNRYFTALNK